MKSEQNMFYEIANLVTAHPDCESSWNDRFKEKEHTVFLDNNGSAIAYYEGSIETGLYPRLQGQIFNDNEHYSMEWPLKGEIIEWKFKVDEGLTDKDLTAQEAYTRLTNLCGRL